MKNLEINYERNVGTTSRITATTATTILMMLVSVTNACGNGKLPMYVFCQNTGSQVQGEDNSVAISSVQSSGEDRHDGGGHGGGGGDYED